MGQSSQESGSDTGREEQAENEARAKAVARVPRRRRFTSAAAWWARSLIRWCACARQSAQACNCVCACMRACVHACIRSGGLRSLQHVEYEPVDLDGDEPTAHVNCQTAAVWRRTAQSLSLDCDACIGICLRIHAVPTAPARTVRRSECMRRWLCTEPVCTRRSHKH
jgi:hypothetical protein